MTTIKNVLEAEIKERETRIAKAKKIYDESVEEHMAAIKAMRKMVALFDKYNKVFNAISATVTKE